jgi:hypothetical protein
LINEVFVARLHPPKMSLWIGAPPSVAERHEAVGALVQDPVTLSASVGVTQVWTSEPRSYATTPTGIEKLLESIAQVPPDALIFTNAPTMSRTSITFQVTLRSRYSGEFAVRIGGEFAGGGPAPDVLLNLTRRWFAELGAAAAFIRSVRAAASADRKEAIRQEPALLRLLRESAHRGEGRCGGRDNRALR